MPGVSKHFNGRLTDEAAIGLQIFRRKRPLYSRKRQNGMERSPSINSQSGRELVSTDRQRSNYDERRSDGVQLPTNDFLHPWPSRRVLQASGDR